MSPLELLLFGGLCYFFGVISGVVAGERAWLRRTAPLLDTAQLRAAA